MTNITTLKRVPFASLPIDTEFMWGAWDEADMNWGRKRSSRTADYRPRIAGRLSDHVDWAYFSQNEVVYLSV